MSLQIGDEVPDFTAETTQGTINFHEWIGDGWAVLFSHPKDFTPVCTTELGSVAGLQPEFTKRNCKIAGLSIDSVSDLREACKRAGIAPPANFHSLRHTYASLLVMADVPLVVVAKNLGHADTRMCERHYAHLAPSYVAETIRSQAPKLGIVEPSKVARLTL